MFFSGKELTISKKGFLWIEIMEIVVSVFDGCEDLF